MTVAADYDLARVQRRVVRVLVAGQVLGGVGIGATLAIGAVLAAEISGSDAWAGAAATLSTLGAVIGIALGISAAKLVEWKTPLPAAVAPWSLIAATLLGTVVGIVSGVYPARRAARLDPIEALRQE